MTAVEISSKPKSKYALPRRRAFMSRGMLLLAAFVALAIVAASLVAAGMGKPAQQPTAPVALPALMARGTIEPIAKASIATMGGGVARSLRVQVGQTVEVGQTIAQINTPAQAEMLVAPWSGTIMGPGMPVLETPS